MAKLGLDEFLLPLLLERGRERRGEQNRLKREKSLREALIRIKSGGSSQDQKYVDYVKLQQGGINLKPSILDPKIDLKKLGAPQFLIDGVEIGAFSQEEAYKILIKKNMANEVKASDEDLRVTWDSSPQLQGEFPTREGPVLYRKAKEWLSEEVANKAYGFAGGGPSALEEKNAYLESVKDKNLQWFIDNPHEIRKMKIHGITTKDLYKSFGYDPDGIIRIEKSIRDQIVENNPLLKLRFPHILAQWMSGEKTAYDVIFSKWFDRENGELKPEVVIAELARVNELALQAIGMSPAQGKEIPIEYRGVIAEAAKEGVTTKEEVKTILDSDRKKALNPLAKDTIVYTPEQILEIIEYFQ